MFAYCRFCILVASGIMIALAGFAVPAQAQDDVAVRIYTLARKLHESNISRENFTEWVHGNLGISSEGLPEGLSVGKPMPDFAFDLFNGSGQVKRSDLKGPYILNFWASWCPPCVEEFPLLIKGIEQGKLKMAVLFVDVFDERAEAERFLKTLSPKITVVTDDARSTFARTHGINAIPQTMLVDAKGNLQAIHSGDMTDISIEFFAEIAAHPGIGAFDASNPDKAPNTTPVEKPSGGASFFRLAR